MGRIEQNGGEHKLWVSLKDAEVRWRRRNEIAQVALRVQAKLNGQEQLRRQNLKHFAGA